MDGRRIQATLISGKGRSCCPWDVLPQKLHCVYNSYLSDYLWFALFLREDYMQRTLVGISVLRTEANQVLVASVGHWHYI